MTLSPHARTSRARHSHARTAEEPREEIIDHLKPMRAFALSLTREMATADDLVQDTIVKAWTKFDRFEPGSNLRAWLFVILRNTFYSDLRKRRREVGDPDGVAAARLAEKPAHDGKLDLTDFLRAFEKLPAVQREALSLVGAQGFSYSDAAEVCHCAVGTMKSRVCRGRQNLLDKLDRDGPAELADQAAMAVIDRNCFAAP